MRFLTKKVTGIEFHDHLVQFVELKKQGDDAVMESYNRAIIPRNIICDGEIKNSNELKEIVRALLESANPNPPSLKNVALMLPTSITFTHIFELPAVFSRDELQKSLPFEAEKILPFSIDDVYWDFSILEKGEKNKKESAQVVLFAAVPKTSADQYAALLGSLGIVPFLFGINLEALKFSLRKQLRGNGLNLVIAVDALSTNYMVMQGMSVKRFFSDNKGVEALIEELSKEYGIEEDDLFEKWEKNTLDGQYKEFIQKFIGQRYKKAERVISEFLREKNIKDIDSLYFTGEFSNLPHFKELVTSYFTKKSIIIGDPKLNLLIDDARFLPKIKVSGDQKPFSVFFTNVIGVSLQGLFGRLNTEINLLPDSLKIGFADKKSSFLMGLASSIMVVVSLLVASYTMVLHSNTSFERLLLEGKKSEVELMIFGTRYQEIKEALMKFNDEVSILSSIDNTLISVPSMLDSIINEFPNGIVLNSIAFRDGNLRLTLSGVADDRESLLKLKEKMQSLDFVTSVDLPLSNFDQKTQISFVIELNLNFSKLPGYAEN